ncbi:MAG: metal-dependent transcriptional regulator [Nitrososphaeraceae archaeon]
MGVLMDNDQNDTRSFSKTGSIDFREIQLVRRTQTPGTRLASIRDANRIARESGRRTDRMEDYLEVVYELVHQRGYATTVDISEYLNVSSPSVTSMMKKLDEKGFLRYEKYRGMSLTDKGIEVAKAIHRRHGILSEFFRIIGVQSDIANEDAEGIEHHLHLETLKKLEEFVNSHKLAGKI